ncbi:MAG: signal recognition particle-docking protein FtsY [Devosia sp.]|uniref:signal recognition particle-docking protein FtsY n=1 Tax=unclassified Devosia TaxID=196773 RepID=UPI0019EE7331|nr:MULTISPECIES: signal recognition particle-docking protein FtsY [unclassified Devosia]MBF0679931.1 signal recognition particle-docking protein FtsY [Devosia sp.]WEJ33117.1 signal recognition particle-docking protein FtsY [Devosia sp. SD17-2]
MSDKVSGFFKRLFGTEPAPTPTPAPPETLPETPVAPPAPAPEPEPVAPAPESAAPPPVPEPAPAPEPEIAPEPELEPEVVPEPEDVPPPGPPETTPEYIEAVEDQFVAPPAPVAPPAERQSWFTRLASGLRRSSDNLTASITSVFTKKKLDAATLDELEDVLIQADLGLETAMAITEALRKDRFDKDVSGEDVRSVLASEVEKVLGPVARPLDIDTSKKPFIILMIGVNGSGKTTTIGKLAQKLSAEGKSVMLAAGDTFRAAAIEQLQVWGQRTGAPVISKPAGADASGLAFDAVTQAKAEGRDVLIIDTAGRLQNRDELMNELEKIIRVIKKVEPSAPHATLLTLDATTGQNAMKQVEIFGKRAGVTGLVMTKLDGTARGGILVAISKKFGLPVHFIGVGEGVDDLEPFSANEFARAIAGRD